MSGHIATGADFAAQFDVSRETLERLEHYAALLARWNRRINLVGRGTLSDVWHRHFADSAQLWPLRPPEARLWLDLGSGAGFPGLVIATLAAPARSPHVALVESDLRKVAFLQTVARELALEVTIHPTRIQDLPPLAADVVSARALAPLHRLIAVAKNYRHARGTCLFPKGETVHSEIKEAQESWRFEYKIHPSTTEPAAAVVEIGAIHGAREHGAGRLV